MAEENVRAAKRRRYTSRIIKLHAGRGGRARTVSVHEANLRKSSPFFRAALDNEHWKEGISGEIDLPEDHADIITGYVHWLYHKEIERVKHINKSGKLRAYYSFMVDLYLFGERLQDDEFCDDVLCAILLMLDKPEWCPGSNTIARAYAGTPVGSPLRKLLVDVWTEEADSSWFDEKTHNTLPGAFTIDLLKALAIRRTGPSSQLFYPRRATWMKKKAV